MVSLPDRETKLGCAESNCKKLRKEGFGSFFKSRDSVASILFLHVLMPLNALEYLKWFCYIVQALFICRSRNDVLRGFLKVMQFSREEGN